MKTSIFGAGPIGSLHAYLLHNAGKDEMIELGNEFKTLIHQTSVETPNLNELINCIN